MPPTRNVPMSVRTSTAYSFGNGSVVMMARAAAAPPSGASAADGLRNAGAQRVHLQVDADHAGRRDQHLLGRRSPTAAAVSAAISRASAMPCGPVQALAQPLLVTMARRLAAGRRPGASSHTSTGAALARLVVKTPAALRRRVADDAAARSGLPLALMPQCRPLARKPDGAVMPPANGDAISATAGPHGGARAGARLGMRLPRQVQDDRRTGRSCGTAGTSGSRARSSPAPRCAARSRSPSRTKKRGSCANAHRRANPSRRARRPSSSTMRWPRPALARLAADDERAHLGHRRRQRRQFGAADDAVAAAMAARRRTAARDRSARRASAAAGGLPRDARQSARAGPARRRPPPRAASIAGAARSRPRRPSSDRRPAARSVVHDNSHRHAFTSTVDLSTVTAASAPSRIAMASSISAADHRERRQHPHHASRRCG